MSTQPSAQHTTVRGRRLVALWAAGLLLVYFTAGCVGVLQLSRHRSETEQSRQAWQASSTTESGRLELTSGAPVDVSIGVSVNRIGEFDLKEAAWTADFDVWFQWDSDLVNPGETFGVVNGQELRRDRKEDQSSPTGRFVRYGVTARLAKSVDPSRFPFGDEGLTIDIEDAIHDSDTLRYVAGTPVGIGDPFIPQEINVKQSGVVVGTHRYPFTLDPPAGRRVERSRFTLAMLVQPASASVYLRMYQALFASVAIAFIAFFITPSHVDPRFGLPVGAFFAAIGNNVFVGATLPQGGGITLSTMVNGIGLVTIFFVLLQSAVSLYLVDTKGQAQLSQLFDRVSFVVLLVGYAGVNLALPISAMP